MTELKGNYEFTLVFEPDMSGMRSMVMMAGGPGRGGDGPPPGGGAGGGAGGGDGVLPKGNDEPAPPLLSAVQDQLGLKLEPKKAPVDLIVIDRLEKVPTDN
jgi:uncharacterized protein (TIGR03435 family)